LIVDTIDESEVQTLAGNTRPEATTQNDAGAVPASLTLDHILLVMRRSANQEQALQKSIDQLHDPKSASFHKWFTAAAFGQQYGLAQQDIDTIASWLRGRGFVVNSIYPSGSIIDFSGTAGQINAAFHTSIHYLNVNGNRHLANMSDPEIPAALAPAVAGIASLHDFSPHAMHRARANYTFTDQGSTYQAVTPSDLATIYDFAPLYQAGITGAGQTIAVLEDATLYSTSDWNTFRTTFGLSQYSSGSLAIVNPAPPSGSNNCTAPGLAQGDDGEAIIDAEWASASAPGATIEVATCASTRTTFGGLIALQNLLNSTNPPEVVSISYGECEAGNGAAANAAYASAYEQAVAEGVSVYVSAGDSGAASCDAGAAAATHGIGVSGFASTPYNVAVGGTDFSDTYDGTNSTYWSSTNTSTYGSALSYIPEVPWNDSCAGALVTSYLGYSSSYGSSGLCASFLAQQYSLVDVVAASGGPSGCATGSPIQSGIVGGSCKGYPKPSWQGGVSGVPNDNVRDLPDISMFAGAGMWGHYYIYCWSDTSNGGAKCTGDPSNWAGAGGTSFGAPILAGLQALINQYAGGPQGNPNYVYYNLAGQTPSLFHNIIQGDMDVNCGGTQNCYGATTSTAGPGGFPGFAGFPGGFGGGRGQSEDGALSLSSSSYNPAYDAEAGWNFATGLGTIDAYYIVMNWPIGN
jgi:subtilase family serine protease